MKGIYLGKQVSSRHSALRAGNRAGMLAGMMARGGERMSRDQARRLASDNAAGQSCGPHPVPGRWRPLYVRIFVKAAIFAYHTHRAVTSNSKYGVA